MSDKVAHQRLLVEQDREDLGRTVHALAEKVNVRARAKGAMKSTKMRMGTATRRCRRVDAVLTAAGTAAMVVAVISVVVWWRRR